MVQAVCGSPVIFLYDVQQIIIDIDVKARKFQFSDSQSIHNNAFESSQSNVTAEVIAEIVILGGGFYGQKLEPIKDKTVEQIVKDMDQQKKANADRPAEEKDTGKALIQATSASEESKKKAIELYKCMKLCLLEIPPVLTRQGQLANKNRDNKPDFIYNDLDDIVGRRFKNDVYQFMSRGLVSPAFLELISNQELMTESLVAPSNLNKSLWESADFKKLIGASYSNFMRGEDFQNGNEKLGATQHMFQ